MGTLTDQDEALTRLSDALAADKYPVLDESALTRLLEQSVIAALWQAETPLNIGDVVVPTVYNGLCYAVIAATGDRETGATEPEWPVEKGVAISNGDLTFRSHKDAPEALWDMALAEHLGWKRKLALVGHEFDFGVAGGDRFNRSQQAEQFRLNVEMTAPFSVG
jgi:hypothetical protein